MLDLLKTPAEVTTTTGVELWPLPHPSPAKYGLKDRVKVWLARFPNRELQYLITIDGEPWRDTQQLEQVSIWLYALPLIDKSLVAEEGTDEDSEIK